MADKFCAQCGRAFSDADKFCGQCGTPRPVDSPASKDVDGGLAEDQMDVCVTFYGGIQYYYGDNETDEWEEDEEELALNQRLSEAFTQGRLRVELTGLGIAWPKPLLDDEATLDSDTPGHPSRWEIIATFGVPSSVKENVKQALTQAWDESRLHEVLTAVLFVDDVVEDSDGWFELVY